MSITDGEEYASNEEFLRDEYNAIESLALTFDPDPLQTIRNRHHETHPEFDPDEWHEYNRERDL